MVSCDGCDEWFHSDCVSSTIEELRALDTFLCPLCDPVADGGGEAGGGDATAGCGDAFMRFRDAQRSLKPIPAALLSGAKSGTEAVGGGRKRRQSGNRGSQACGSQSSAAASGGEPSRKRARAAPAAVKADSAPGDGRDVAAGLPLSREARKERELARLFEKCVALNFSA